MGSALLFFGRLKAVNGWESMAPSLAAHTVQMNGDITLSDGSVLRAQDYYTQFYGDASRIVEALGGAGGGACAGVSGDAVQLAQQIMAAHEQGRFVTLPTAGQPDHLPEIAEIAAGTSKEGCGIDVGILQVMVAALQNFDSVSVCDINRACTGQLLGTGAMSSHNVDGGGHAVDFYMLNGAAVTGCDGSSLRLLSILDAMMLKGSRAGQAQCRSTTFVNLTQFGDAPNHLHIDNAYAGTTG